MLRTVKSRALLKRTPTDDVTGVLPTTFSDGLPLPDMFVFDLDYTLWPFWVDTHVTPPLKSVGAGSRVKDQYGESFSFFDDVLNILPALRQKGIRVAAASRTDAPDLAREMLKLLKVPTKPVQLPPSGSVSTAKAIEFFDHLQIFPGSKMAHFEQLQKETRIPYETMIFFDDESRNKEVEDLGVVMYLVRNGVTNDEVDKGVLSWRKRNRRELE